MTPLEHVAGPYQNGVQLCTRCEEVLIDVRGLDMPDGGALVAWQEGARVWTNGRNWAVVAPDEPPGPSCGGLTLMRVLH